MGNLWGKRVDCKLFVMQVSRQDGSGQKGDPHPGGNAADDSFYGTELHESKGITCHEPFHQKHSLVLILHIMYLLTMGERAAWNHHRKEERHNELGLSFR